MNRLLHTLMLALACLQPLTALAQTAGTSSPDPKTSIQRIVDIATKAVQPDSSPDERAKAVELIGIASQALSASERNELIALVVPALEQAIAKPQADIRRNHISSIAFLGAFLTAFALTGGTFGASTKFWKSVTLALFAGGATTLWNGERMKNNLAAHIDELIVALAKLQMQNNFEIRMEALGTDKLI